MIGMIAKTLQKSADHVAPADPTLCVGANRPYDTELICERPIKYATPIEEGIAKAFAKFSHGDPRSAPQSQFFHLFDLDGTLVDSDKNHFIAYQDACMELGIELSWITYEKALNNGTLDSLFELLGVRDMPAFKQRKLYFFKIQNDFEFMPGAEDYLRALLDSKQNIVIVTNTSRECVEHMKICLPLLQNVSQWIVRSDYVSGKPNPECYNKAYALYYKGEPQIIAYENTVGGYNAVKGLTDIVYIITQKDTYAYKNLIHEDVYLIQSYDKMC
jgi:beta-phosphoglucomutase-like phosphatase (HAD superfamily)